MTIRHIVIAKFKETASDSAVETVVQKFDELAKSLDIVTAYERGTQNSKEGLDGGFSHIFQLDFANTATRDEYVGHAEHKAFVDKQIRPNVESIMVVDYQIAFDLKK